MVDPGGRPRPAAVRAILRLSWRRFGHSIGRMPKVLLRMRQPTRGRITTTPWLYILLAVLMLVQSFVFTRTMVGDHAGRILDQTQGKLGIEPWLFEYLKSQDPNDGHSLEMIRFMLKSGSGGGRQPIPPEVAMERFQQQGIEGFRSERQSLWRDASLANVPPRDRAPFDRVIGMILLATLVALLFMPFALRERDLAATNGQLEWLFSLPLRGSEILLGKFVSTALIRPLLYLVLWPLLTNLLNASGHAFPVAAMLGLALGFLVSVALAGIELVFDTWLRSRATAATVQNLLMVLMITGQLAFYAVLAACIASGPSLPWVSWLASRLPGDIGQPLGSLVMAPPSVLIPVTLAAAVAFGLGGFALSSRLLRSGLLSGGGRPTQARRLGSKDLRSHGRLRYEWLLLLRDRSLATQVIAVPLLLVFYQGLINPSLLENATVAGITAGAYLCGTFASLSTAHQLLASEARGAWLIYNLPIPVASYFRGREQFWRGISTVLAGLLMLTMILLSGSVPPGDGWRCAAALAGVWVMGRMVSGIVLGQPRLPDAFSGTRPRLSIGRTYAAMLLAGGYGALLYQGKPWPLVGALVAFSLLGTAIWQRREISFRHLMEPVAKEPPSWGVDDALWSVFVFLLFQNLSLRLLSAAAAPDGHAMMIAYLAGGIAALGFAHRRRRSKALPLPSPDDEAEATRLPRSRILMETAAAALLCIAAAGGWITLLKAGWFIDPAVLSDSLDQMRQPVFWVVAILMAPLIEEPLFRGFILRTMTAFWSRKRSIVTSALVFAIIHPGTSFPPVFLLGIATAILYLRSRSVVAPILLHAAYNLAVFVIATHG